MYAFEITQPEIHTRPLADVERWELVVEAAGYRCQCTGGRCGSQHSRTDLRCPIRHDQYRKGPGRVRLIVAPDDLTLSDVDAVALPAESLRAWCPECYQATRRRQREDAAVRRRFDTDPPATLF
ncbi:hypothetical protein [Streptomyces scopuliridis]|uniref:hypothetical protein n=1 Tax=Streptomyces scopuliridis TaxID=452529 RepID=UPI0035E28F23